MARYAGVYAGRYGGSYGGGSTCNVYLFSSADGDYLSLDPFTGNLKVQLAATSEAGVHPEIVAGRIGSFTASVDPVKNPQWNYYDIEAVGVDYVVGAVFNGVVGGYWKDDVEHRINMGPQETQYAWYFNGLSYGAFPARYLQTAFSIAVTCEGLVSGDEIVSSDDDTVDGIYIDTNFGVVRAFAKVSGTNTDILTAPFNGVIDDIELSVDGSGVATLTVNGASDTGSFALLNGNQCVSLVAKRGASISTGGTYSNLVITDINTPANSLNFPLREAFGTHTFTDTLNGVVGTKYNDLAEDYVEV